MVTNTTPTARTGRDPHCRGVRYWPSSQTAKKAVGMILKDCEQIWNVTASRWLAATITSTCTPNLGVNQRALYNTPAYPLLLPHHGYWQDSASLDAVAAFARGACEGATVKQPSFRSKKRSKPPAFEPLFSAFTAKVRRGCGKLIHDKYVSAPAA